MCCLSKAYRYDMLLIVTERAFLREMHVFYFNKEEI